jgi:WD40 repeat protein
MRKLLFLGLFLAFTAQLLDGQQGPKVPTEPRLRIETGTHIGRISRLSVDGTGTFLVTASEDKTVRVWDLASGILLNTLRPPIGDGYEGAVYSAAISPDGNTVAAGGWTGYEWDKTNCIYLFDRESGRIVNRIQNLPQVIQHSEYSPNGRYLAVLLGADSGVRIYETETYSLIAEDRDYSVRGEFLNFDSTSTRLVTSSFDGNLRLYDLRENSLRLVKKRRLAEKGLPVGVKFSPDGSSIAVGFAEILRVMVVSAFDLSILFEPDLSKTTNGELSLVVWSQDGRSLFAIGRIGNTKTGINSICLVRNNGREITEMPATIGSVYDLISLPTGGAVFAGSNPASWGTLDSSGNRRIYVDSKAPDFNRSFEGLMVNGNATTVRYANQRYDRFPTVFSVSDRRLTEENNRRSDLKSPRVRSSKLEVLGWNRLNRNGPNPTLNGRPLRLLEFEDPHSLAVLPNEKNFLLGTGWFLRLYSHEGEELWRIQTPSNANSVNTDGKGKIAAVMVGDGTIRWYRISDGQELLALFSPNDGSGRWILWTPSGYYDASSDAEDLIGWHVNTGSDSAADFFPNHLFREYFYRPDVINEVLKTADESLAIKLANEKGRHKKGDVTIARILPPVVELNSPKVKSVSNTTLEVSYTLRNHSKEPVTTVRALIDDYEIKLPVKDKWRNRIETLTFTIEIPKKDSELTLIAENRYTKSLPSKIKLKWQPL